MQLYGTHCAFSGDGLRLGTAGGAFNRNLDVYDVGTGEQIADIYTGNYVYGMALSYDATLGVTCGPHDDIDLWSVPTGEHRDALSGHTSDVGDVDLSSDGTLIVSGAKRCRAFFSTRTSQRH